MLLFLVVPIALAIYFLVLRFAFRAYRYRWAVWLWGLTFVLQLPFFFKLKWGWRLAAFTLSPFASWLDVWRHTPIIAGLLLVVPSVPAFVAWGVQYRRYTRAPAPPSPPRPWVLTAVLVTYLALLLALGWWLSKR